MKSELFVPKSITIKEAMKILDATAEKCLIVVEKANKLFGTLTDGDIRRAILSGANFDKEILSFCNRNPVKILEQDINKTNLKKLMLDKNLDLLPIIDHELTVKNYVTRSGSSLLKKDNNTLNIPVVIMAGGKGTRMGPFTKVLPKPLIPIQDKTIIEHIIESFNKVGCNDFNLTINYKSKIIKAYFEDLNPQYTISFINEPKPLGTAGSLIFIKDKYEKTFFVTNCDILIKASYEKIYRFHLDNKNEITLVASAKEYVIPYGTCELDKSGEFDQINEKPKLDFLINTGLYLLENKVLELIPENEFYHITHLIEKAKKKGFKIGVYPINDDDWIDIGQWVEYKKVVNNL